MKVEIWSDVVCPWCYVGKRRFEQALGRFEHRDSVQVRWRSFELDPAAPRVHEGGYAERLAAKYGTPVAEAQQRVAAMSAAGAADGLDLRFDLARPGNTLDAHRLLHFAAASGVQDALKERLLRACFTEGEPVGDAKTLVRLSGEVGLDPASAWGVLGTDAYAAEVRADEQRAAALGISGVPFFVIEGRYGVSGAQSPGLLLEVLQRAEADSASLATASRAGDTCST